MESDAEMTGEQDQFVVVEVVDEDHTLGNVVRDVMWSHPHISVAQYTQENDASDKAVQILLHCQTVDIHADQGMWEALDITKRKFHAVAEAMDDAVKRYEADKGRGGQ